jgi:hypothetical protein
MQNGREIRIAILIAVLAVVFIAGGLLKLMGII